MLRWSEIDSDLHFDSRDGLSATNMSEGAFCLLWAGARATRGVKSGRYFFEICVTGHNRVRLPHTLPDLQGEVSHVCRVGWSLASTGLQLGEESGSFGYGGTGRASTDNQFEVYGERFDIDDVIACMFDANSGAISFAKNGRLLGSAFRVPADVRADGLFPHILLKNVKAEVNFGHEPPWSDRIPNGFQQIQLATKHDSVSGAVADGGGELVMLVGLPASGKTHWTEGVVQSEPEMHWNILGTNQLLERMKVSKLRKTANYGGRWEVLIKEATFIFNKLLERAPLFARNYILDQTNVYANARRRKLSSFDGFLKRALVFVPDDDEFKRRREMQRREGKSVPEHVVKEMIANFEFPAISAQEFDEVKYVELGEHAARTLIDQYRRGTKRAAGEDLRAHSRGASKQSRHAPPSSNSKGASAKVAGASGSGAVLSDPPKIDAPKIKSFAQIMAEKHAKRGKGADDALHETTKPLESRASSAPLPAARIKTLAELKAEKQQHTEKDPSAKPSTQAPDASLATESVRVKSFSELMAEKHGANRAAEPTTEKELKVIVPEAALRRLAERKRRLEADALKQPTGEKDEAHDQSSSTVQPAAAPACKPDGESSRQALSTLHTPAIAKKTRCAECTRPIDHLPFEYLNAMLCERCMK